MKNIVLLFFISTLSIYAQDLKWEDSIEGVFIVDSVTLNEPSGEGNIVNVSGTAGDSGFYRNGNSSARVEFSSEL